MTATLTLPDVHYVTDGEWLTAGLDGDGCPYELPTLRVWWWPVDGEWEQNDSVGLHGTDEFGPPADLVKLAEPCDESQQGGWICDGEGLLRDAHGLVDGHCPDCHNGDRIVQLTRMCSVQRCQQGRILTTDRHGSLWVDCAGCHAGIALVARVTITLWSSDELPPDLPSEIDVQPGQWVLRAEEAPE